MAHRGAESAKVLLREGLSDDSRSAPMPTECSAELFKFAAVGSRSVVAGFDGGASTSDAGAMLAGKREARRANCAPVAGKSTLNRLELSREQATRYHKLAHDPAALEGLFVTLFLEAHQTAPREIILDLDATDDPLHGHQEE